MVQLRDPDSGMRHFGCYATWEEGLEHLRRLRGARRHLFEIIPHGQPCKPYLDLDAPSLPAKFATLDELVAHADKVICAIFASDYEITLRPEEDLVWLVSPGATLAGATPGSSKVSLHLTVSTGVPVRVFSSNHQDDPQGASHLAMRIRQLDPGGLGSMVDVSVYSKDREMRCIGASKYGKASVLEPYRPYGPGGSSRPKDALITNVPHHDMSVQLIEVPTHIPRVLRTERRTLRKPEEAAEQDAPQAQATVITRMLDLLRCHLHPSAYHDRGHGAEDAKDPLRGVKFGYTDRQEPCYTGHVHSGTQNLRCWVDAGGTVMAKCFSSACVSRAAHRLGRVTEESDAFVAGAIRVDLPYMQRVPVPAALLDDPRDMYGDDSAAFNVAVQKWLRGDVRVLSLRSPMGTGKSTFIDALLTELPPETTVLTITYRQSLAAEHERKMRDHGFVSYLKVGRGTDAGSADLADREAYPRVICQIESLRRLGSDLFQIPLFDVIILDEVESVLRHWASPTVVDPMFSMDSFVKMLQHTARGVITLDAAWGAATYDVLQKARLSNLLVVNVRRPAVPRTFAFTNDEAPWMDEIAEDLAAGLNVVVVSLSAQRAMAVGEAAARIVGAERVLVHTSKSADDIKQRLINVDELWTAHQVVVFSPTIAAGTDFSSVHFGRMYFYACAMSALPSTALQMLFRVRHVADATVRCCAASNMRMSTVASVPPLTSRDMMQWLRWMDIKLRPRDICGSTAKVQVADVFRPRTTQVHSANLPPLSYWYMILSYVEAERYNARIGYLREFEELAVAAGHRVSIARISGARPDVPSLLEGALTTEQAMLSVPRVMGEAQFDELRSRVHGNVASEEDKWRFYVAAYQQAWCLGGVDAAFLAKHGTQPAAPKVKLLARVLCPQLRTPRGADVSLEERSAIFKVPVLEETVAALGLRSPFDDETVVTDLMACFDERLRLMPMWQDYARNARLFRQGPGMHGEWDLAKVVKSVNMVLGAAGLSLVGNTVRVQAKKVKSKTTTYRLCTDGVCEMLELVKLRLDREGCDVRCLANEHARQRIEECTLPRWGHLVSKDCMPWGQCFSDEEEDVSVDAGRGPLA